MANQKKRKNEKHAHLVHPEQDMNSELDRIIQRVKEENEALNNVLSNMEELRKKELSK